MWRKHTMSIAPTVVVKRKFGKPSPTRPNGEKPTQSAPPIIKVPAAPAVVRTAPPPAPTKVARGAAVVMPPTPALPSKKTVERKAKYDLLCLLSERFPTVFVRSLDLPIFPLAVGIREAVVRAFPDQPPRRVASAIALYQFFVRESYLAALAEGRCRIGLDGTPTTEPTPPERELAAKQLAEWREKKEQSGKNSPMGR
jgi:RNA chaperone ProQ/FINO-like protein